MLEDAAGIRRVVLACGTVDLRKGIDVAWQRSSAIGMDRILSRKEPCSCFAGNVLTDARGFYGWDYPQTFVIRTFYLLMIPDAGFLEKMCG